jgi:RimJ/RimL family protein N-acetyltransferase
MIIERASHLVYEYESACPPLTQMSSDVGHLFLNQSQIYRFFADTGDWRRLFCRFVKQGFTGVVLHKGDEWVAYAWLATPRSPQPIHLPSWVKGSDMYWVFYCRTRDEYRNRGYFEMALRILLRRAFEEVARPAVYIDACPVNSPSRRAMLDVGFRPRRIVACTSLGIPGLKRHGRQMEPRCAASRTGCLIRRGGL